MTTRTIAAKPLFLEDIQPKSEGRQEMTVQTQAVDFDLVKQRLINEIQTLDTTELQVVAQSRESFAYYLRGIVAAIAGTMGYAVGYLLGLVDTIIEGVFSGLAEGWKAGWRAGTGK